MVVKFRALGDGAPEVVFNDQEFGLGVGQQGEVLVGGELVVERHQNSPRIKDRIRRNQPFGLVRHDDGTTHAGMELRVLQGAGQGQRHLLEVGIRQAGALAVAIGLNEASLVSKAVQSVAQRRPQRGVLVEIEHGKLISPQWHRAAEKTDLIDSIPTARDGWCAKELFCSVLRDSG